MVQVTGQGVTAYMPKYGRYAPPGARIAVPQSRDEAVSQPDFTSGDLQLVDTQKCALLRLSIVDGGLRNPRETRDQHI